MAKPIFIKEINLSTLAMSTSTIAFGSAAALVTGSQEILPGILCLLFAWFFQIAFNLRHRYHELVYHYGENENDSEAVNSADIVPTRFVLKEGSVAACIFALTIGLGIISFAGWWTVLYGLVLFGLAWLNYVAPNQLSRTPFGIVVTFLLFGPVGVVGSTFVQIASGFNNGSMPIHTINWHDLGPAIYLGLASGFMAINCHLAFTASSAALDKANGKRTFSVIAGPVGAEVTYIANGFLMLLCFIVMQIFGHLTYRWFALVVPTIVSVFYFFLWNSIHKNPDKKGFNILIKYSLLAMLIVAVATFIFYLIFGAPDISMLEYF